MGPFWEMQRMRLLLGVLLLATVAGAEDFSTFKTSNLTAIIGNNAAHGEHRPLYNGVFSVTWKDETFSPFVPLYAGLNLEHYFDGGATSGDNAVFFEPRHAPMTFRRIDERTAELHQPVSPHYGVESWTTFTLRDPHYIDMHFRCVGTKPAMEDDFLGVFWASYMNAPLNKSIYFLQAGSTLDAPQWAQLCTQSHGVQSSVLHEHDNGPTEFSKARSDVLFANFSSFRYSMPFYYGQIRDKVVIFIFKPGPLVRFAHSPSGGGKAPAEDDTNPAWDFQLFAPDYAPGQEYALDLRMVYKPWVDRADVLKEVRMYLDAVP